MTTAAFSFFILFTWMVSSNTWFRVCHQCSDFDSCGHTEGKGSQNAFTQLAHPQKAAVHRKANLTWKRWVELVVNYSKLTFYLHCWWSFTLFSWIACFQDQLVVGKPSCFSGANVERRRSDEPLQSHESEVYCGWWLCKLVAKTQRVLMWRRWQVAIGEMLAMDQNISSNWGEQQMY